jgi:uncharacterized membrane protein
VRTSAPRHYTSATLSAGVVLSGLCFVIALLAETVGVESQAGDMTDVAAVLEGLGAMAPWAWATLGSYVVVLTPAVALLVTIAEYASVSERLTVLTATAVFAILAFSAIVALMR